MNQGIFTELRNAKQLKVPVDVFYKHALRMLIEKRSN